MPMTARKESAKTKREDMCHRRKTIQVSSIWVFLRTPRRGHDRAVKAESSPEWEGGDGMGSYVPEHVGFTGWIHVHVAVAVAVIH